MPWSVRGYQPKVLFLQRLEYPWQQINIKFNPFKSYLVCHRPSNKAIITKFVKPNLD